MDEPKLILIEGIPGSGKTTTAQFAADWLQRCGVETALFLEGNLDHPADFESVACLTGADYAEVSAAFPADRPLLERWVAVEEGDHFFPYRRMQESDPRCSAQLIAALARYEIYELPTATWRRLLLRRWRRFASTARSGQTSYLFECCFLQNPLTLLLGRNDEPIAAAEATILDFAAAIHPLSPRLIYLHPGDVRQTLLRVAQTRPQSWLDFVIAYHTEQGHGLAQGWQGFEGLVNFYKMRQAVELSLLPKLPFPTLLLEHTTWSQDQSRIANFLAAAYP